jgi:Primase C terminal 2 (PriCT-2)/Family of unknown function (DUF5906)
MPEAQARTMPLQATLFQRLKDPAGRALDWSWPLFCQLLEAPPKAWSADDKHALPLVKLGRFAGDSRGAGHELLTITGLEGDYDAGAVSPADAAALLNAAGVESVVVTTPTHTPQAPRWRVFAPLAAQYAAERRAPLLARLNGVLGGVLARESFTPKQAYFVGRVNGQKHFECYRVEGERIDHMPALDAGAVLPAMPDKTDKTDEEPASDDAHNLRLAGNAANWEDNKATLLGALNAIDPGCNYRTWMEVSAALFFASGGKALLDWLEWCAKSTKYPGDEEAAAKWKEFGRMKSFSAGTLYHHAGAAGWVLGADVKVESKLDSAPDDHTTPIVSLDDCLRNWVWLSGSASVLMRERNGYTMKWGNAQLTYVASKTTRPDNMIRVANASKKVPVTSVWHADKRRIEVEEVTYMPGLPQFCQNPLGAKSFNLWAPVQRRIPRTMDLVSTFLQHVEYLVPEPAQREQFLMWLAHAEQRPEELPMSHWLMITRTQGVGRNWLSALFDKVWPYQVALSVDLPHIFQSGFNGALSRKVMACVDEIDVGGGQSARTKFNTSLKALLTSQMHIINVKYGAQITESNCLRWLMFSNSESAVPLAGGDRRLNVVRNPSEPRTASYYTALYGMLESAEFINAVGYYLRTLDISSFNPGARAVDSEMRRVVVSVSRDEVEGAIDQFCSEWPSAIAPGEFMRDYITQTTGLHRDKLRYLNRTLQHTQAEALLERLHLSTGTTSCVITRDPDKWRSAAHTDKVAECERGVQTWQAKKFGATP